MLRNRAVRQSARRARVLHPKHALLVLETEYHCHNASAPRSPSRMESRITAEVSI